ncbi:MAG: cytochrome b/b6 domain-containing protein [Sphingomonadaceae bacterium]|nr:cytochrome b/b6 domain-containing protein [Sphingomonadaceae bacterium]
MDTVANVRIDTGPPPGQVYYRHRLVTRLCHWINALSLLFLVMTGLNIFDAHPALYWGKYGANPDHQSRWFEIGAMDAPGGAIRGVTRIGPVMIDTSGVLGTQVEPDGSVIDQGFPDWVTFPHNRDLATARRWHFFFAWLFILSGLVYFVHGFATRHLQDEVWPRLKQLRPANLWHDIVIHARLTFPRGAADREYQVLQRLAYAGVVFVLLPLMVLTGLSLSPGFNAALNGFLPSLFGGRASARSIHFIVMDLLIAFTAVHLLMVVLAGPYNQVRSMITGRYDTGEEPE